MDLGLCLAGFGGTALPDALEWTRSREPLYLDLPTDTTLGLVDGVRCATDPAYLDEVAGVVAGHRIGCVSNSRDAQLLLGPHGEPTDPVRHGGPAEKRTHALAASLGTIRLAERVGAASVRLQPGCPDFARWLSWWGSDASWADNVAEFCEHAEPLIEAARAAGVRLLLEPHPKQVVYDRASAELLYTAVPSWWDVLGLCIDPANLAATGHDPVDGVRGWGDRMVAVHAKDLQRAGATTGTGPGWSRYGPQPPIRFRALGLGELDWALIVATLQDEEFGGVLYVEHEDALLPRETSMDRGLDLLRSLVPGSVVEGRTW